MDNEVLASLRDLSIEHSGQWAAQHGHDVSEVHNTIKRLVSLDMAATTTIEQQSLQLTPLGEQVLQYGSPEFVYHNMVPVTGGADKAAVDKAVDAASTANYARIGFPAAKVAGWITLGDGQVSRAVANVADDTATQVRAVADGTGGALDPKLITALTKRKMIVAKKQSFFKVAKGPKWAPELVKKVSELTKEMLEDESWRKTEFKDYNFAAAGIVPASGALHPLLKVRREFRDIFLELGFEEMPTSRFVESSFWNFDTLFQPQQHPARDAHDTFFLTRPAATHTLPEDYVARVKATHENGWETGSTGYVYDWRREEANKNIMRTHTTAVSSRMLYALGQAYKATGVWEPKKYFSIDRVFRNENLDATHLAEFHQIEGLVCDRGITLGHLIGMLQQFFHKMGIEKLRFKPAYNPYTEPSLEVFSWHDGLGKWVEVGNSGVFRPEMLLPMGLPPDVGVIAWGLSLERPTMIRYGFNNIRELIGHKISLSMIQKNPLCRLDK